MKIEDRNNAGVAAVNVKGELSTRIETALVENGLAQQDSYIWQSQDIAFDAGDTFLLLKNTSSGLLVIDQIIVTGGDAISRYEIHVGTAATLPVGVAVTGFNLNTSSSNVAPAIAKADETANTQGTVIIDVALLVTTSLVIDNPGIILGGGNWLACDQVAESAAGAVSFTGHFVY